MLVIKFKTSLFIKLFNNNSSVRYGIYQESSIQKKKILIIDSYHTFIVTPFKLNLE